MENFIGVKFRENVAGLICDSSTSVRAEIDHSVARLGWILKMPEFKKTGGGLSEVAANVAAT